MQTFLPYPDFAKSAQVLDMRRLGKQRVEGLQLIKSQEVKTYSWSKHPASKMWAGYIEALKLYTNTMILEWINRGYNNNIALYNINYDNLVYPAWLGNEQFHASHRSNLLRKNEKYYRQFGWGEPTNLPYIWPIKE